MTPEHGSTSARMGSTRSRKAARNEARARPGPMTQLTKLRSFYDMLGDRGSEGLTVEEAAEKLGVSVKSIYRYPMYLETLFGGPVVGLRKGRGELYLLDDAAFMAALGRDELQALSVARQLLGQIGMPFEAEFRRLSAKLERASGDSTHPRSTRGREFAETQRHTAERLAFVEPHLCRDLDSDQLITDLFRWSLEEPRPLIRFAYRSLTSPDRPERRVHPLGLVFKNAWFLVGHDPTREPRVRVYAVDRMGKPARLAFGPDLAGFDFDVPEHFAHAWRLLGGGQEPHRVTFRLRRGASEERKHASWTVEAEDDAWQTVSVAVAQPEEMIPYLLSKGADLEVLEPLSLRAQVAERLRIAHAAYTSPTSTLSPPSG